MRIITGTAKGKHIATPAGDATRPTSDRIKGAIFSSIQFDIEGRRVLDLFAGCGQLGLEALSRGAASAMFVDAAQDAVSVVKENIKALGFSDKARTLISDYRNYIRKAGGKVPPFDLVFIDPPYAMQACTDALTRLVKEDLLAPGAIIVLECGEEAPDPEAAGHFEVLKSTRYGKKTGIVILLYRGKQGRAKTEEAASSGEQSAHAAEREETGGKKAILPGTYDPVTLGHLDIIRRAAEAYDEVFVTVFKNPEKQPLFSLSDRLAMLMLATDGLDNVLVTASDGRVVDYMREHGIRHIVKGYRNEDDLAYEKIQEDYNRAHGGYETVLLPSAPALSEVSSTLVRERLAAGEPLADLLPAEVLGFLKSEEKRKKP